MSREFLINLVNIGFNVLYLLILARVLMSWLPYMGQSKLGHFISDVTNPILNPLKKVIPNIGPIDITPIIVLLLLSALQNFLLSVL